MGKIKKPDKAKLIIGILTSDKELLKKTEAILEKAFGRIDHKSGLLEFDLTDYYEKEMGRGLLRCWLSFERLIEPLSLSGIKVKTNRIEERSSMGCRRRINLDPGYIESAKLVLASTKNFSHRIYLDKGIYAEVTLIYEDKKFCGLKWTYPDYKTETALRFLEEARKIYMHNL
jgi:hypothetical protein